MKTTFERLWLFSFLMVAWACLPSAAAAPSSAESKVVLSDGRLAVVGGFTESGHVSSAITIYDSTTGIPRLETCQLTHPRAWHSSTVLPDGSVLILGGETEAGAIIAEAEVFDPGGHTTKTVHLGNWTPRSRHTATMLVDGRVLVVGGYTDASHSTTASAEALSSQPLAVLRYYATETGWVQHSASLLNDGRVALASSSSSGNVAFAAQEWFNPSTDSFEHGRYAPLQQDVLLRVVQSSPANQATNVDPRVPFLGIQFSAPAYPLSGAEFKLVTPASTTLMRMTLSEAGRLGFLTLASPLADNTLYTVTMTTSPGVIGTARSETPLLTFTTGVSSEIKANDSLLSIGSTDAYSDGYSPLVAPAAITALSGRIRAVNGFSLRGVKLSIGSVETSTDNGGRFLLTGIPPGRQTLAIDGGLEHGYYEAAVNIDAEKTIPLSFTIWLPDITKAKRFRIPAHTTEEIIVTTKDIPGLEVHIPPGADITDHNGKPVGELSITPIPIDRTPFPLPVGVQVPIYYTIQPGNSYISVTSGDTSTYGARIVYPNYTALPIGSRANFWRYDPDGIGWFVYGGGGVSADGKQVIPDPGIEIPEFSGTMINSGNTPPGIGPAPGDATRDGDPVDLGTGLFVLSSTDLSLPDVDRLELRRVYRNNDGVSRPFGIGATHQYETFLWSANQYTEADLILPGRGSCPLHTHIAGNRLYRRCV